MKLVDQSSFTCALCRQVATTYFIDWLSLCFVAYALSFNCIQSAILRSYFWLFVLKSCVGVSFPNRTDGVDSEMESLESQKPQHMVKRSLTWSIQSVTSDKLMHSYFLHFRAPGLHVEGSGHSAVELSCWLLVVMKTVQVKVLLSESQLSKHSNYKHSSCCCLPLA